ncbi:MAG TPA: di-trans,poly-cis-decaprenylcistransferase [Thermoanaerobaculia bacterium]|nr:di-trans,poly-cis-decaprenylcistransferase [Thermoanaerobaculia bacterium]
MPDEGALLHVAIIMDGNGRWAGARGWPRVAGHRAGAEAVRRTVEAAPSLGIGTLTLYAFSSDNWKRPPDEVAVLMGLFRRYLEKETAALVDRGVRLSVIGRRDRIPGSVADAVRAAESATAGGSSLRLRLAVDYSAQDAILRACENPSPLPVTREAFALRLGAAYGPANEAPDVDLLIRTAGERRLSDFLLWEVAYAELFFTVRMWPDFGAEDLADAVRRFRKRQRRFGGLSAAAPTAASRNEVPNVRAL